MLLAVESMYCRALRLNPLHTEALHGLALVRRSYLDDNPSAVRLLRRAVQARYRVAARRHAGDGKLLIHLAAALFAATRDDRPAAMLWDPGGDVTRSYVAERRTDEQADAECASTTQTHALATDEQADADADAGIADADADADAAARMSKQTQTHALVTDEQADTDVDAVAGLQREAEAAMAAAVGMCPTDAYINAVCCVLRDEQEDLVPGQRPTAGNDFLTAALASPQVAEMGYSMDALQDLLHNLIF